MVRQLDFLAEGVENMSAVAYKLGIYIYFFPLEWVMQIAQPFSDSNTELIAIPLVYANGSQNSS